MLQTNLIFGIQKKIKDGHRATEAPVVQEKEEVLLENFYNPSLISDIHQQTEKAKKQKAHKTVLMTEAFHVSKAEKKLQKDISYFNYLYENFVDESFQGDYQMLLENIFQDTIRLYQECDVTPRVISPALDSNELTENQIVDLYKNSLNENIKNNYTKPLLSGKISELFESEIRILTKKLLEEGVSADIDQVRVYLPFEETVYRFNREIMIPKNADVKMTSFMESATSDYTDLLEETAQDIMKSIEQKIKLLTSMVSPNMFEKAVDSEGAVNAPKMAGISITVDKNFNDEECGDGPCPADAEAMDTDAAEELADEAEAEELDAASEDIVGAEEDARDNMGVVSNVDDLETSAQEDTAELSPAESAGEEDQPGAIEADLPSAIGTANASGSITNDSDVSLQGSGNDNGVAASTTSATLPGSVANAGTDVSNTSDVSLSTANDAPETSASVSSGDGSNDSDVGLQGGGNSNGGTSSAGAQLPGSGSQGTAGPVNSSDGRLSGEVTSASTSSSTEVVGADGDDSNAVLGGAQVPSEDAEVNTETPSESEMDELPLEDNVIPRL